MTVPILALALIVLAVVAMVWANFEMVPRHCSIARVNAAIAPDDGWLHMPDRPGVWLSKARWRVLAGIFWPAELVVDWMPIKRDALAYRSRTGSGWHRFRLRDRAYRYRFVRENTWRQP